MKRTIFLIVFLCLNSAFSNAQSQKLDSLKLVLENLPDKDTTYCNVLNEFAFNHYNINIDTLFKYSREALDISKSLQYIKGEAEATKNIGVGYMSMGKFDEAITYFERAIPLAESSHHYKALSGSYNNIAIINNNQGRYDKALEFHAKALEIRERTKDMKGVSYSLNNIAVIYQNQGKYAKALDYHFKGLKIREDISDSIGIAMSLGNISNLYGELEDFERCEIYQKKALLIREEINDLNGVVLSLLNLGELYTRQNNYNEAKPYFLKALEVAEKIKNSYMLSHIYSFLGKIFLQEENIPKAESYFIMAEEIMLKTGDQLGLANVYIGMAEIGIHKKDYQQAKRYAQKGLDISKKIDQKESIREAYRMLSNLAESEGDALEALKFYKLYKQYSDSLSNSETIKKGQRLEAQYEFEKKEEAIKMEQSKKEAEHERIQATQNWVIFSICLAFVSLLIIATLIIRSRVRLKKSYEALEQANVEISQQKEEITSQADKLKLTNQRLLELDDFKQNMTSMIVHDLKNPLNALIDIGRNTPPNAPEKILAYASQMKTLVLNILDVQKFEDSQIQFNKEKTDFVGLIKEALQQTHYLAKQKNISIKEQFISDGVLEVDAEMMIRVIVNLLTNAIKYTPVNGLIIIKSENIDGLIRLSVKDNGPGIDSMNLNQIFGKYFQAAPQSSSGMKSTGLGLTFCKMAVEAHGGTIGVYSEAGQGAEFWFNLPVDSITGVKELNYEEGEEDGDRIIFSDEERLILQPIVHELKHHVVYMKSEIEKVLEKLPPNPSEAILRWKVKLDKAVHTMNQLYFEDCLKEINIA